MNKTLRSHLKERWTQLTDEDLEGVDGKAERLLEILQERYGYARHQAERDLLEFLDRSFPWAAERTGPPAAPRSARSLNGATT